MVIYQFDCFCEASYIGMTSRLLSKSVKKHIPKIIEKYSISEEKESKSIQVLNALKSSPIAKDLVPHPTCTNSYNLDRFKVV